MTSGSEWPGSSTCNSDRKPAAERGHRGGSRGHRGGRGRDSDRSQFKDEGSGSTAISVVFGSFSVGIQYLLPHKINRCQVDSLEAASPQEGSAVLVTQIADHTPPLPSRTARHDVRTLRATSSRYRLEGQTPYNLMAVIKSDSCVSIK